MATLTMLSNIFSMKELSTVLAKLTQLRLTGILKKNVLPLTDAEGASLLLLILWEN